MNFVDMTWHSVEKQSLTMEMMLECQAEAAKNN
jgi:hypothetical protein